MRKLLGRIQVVDIVAALFAASFFAWLSVRTPGTPTAQWVGVIAFYPLGLAVVWANWLNSRLPDLDARTRAAWRLLALAALALWTSGTAWELYQQLVGAEAWPAWVDHLESVQHALAIAAFLVFPWRSLRGRGRTLFLLDAALVIIAASIVAVYFGLRLWLSISVLENEPLQSMLQGTGVDWLVLVIAAVGALGKRDELTRRSMSWLVFAGVSYIVANYFFSIKFYGVGPGAYRAGDAIDGFWFAAWVFRWVAARTLWYGRRATPSRQPRPDRSGNFPEAELAARYDSGGFAYLVVGGCLILLISRVVTGTDQYAVFLAFSTMAMLAVLLLRQLMELRESDGLFRAQAAQEARLRSLVDHSSDAVLIADKGVVTYASPTVSRVFGDDSPVSPGVRLLDIVREDDRDLLRPVLEGRGGSHRLLLHSRTADGRWREIEAVWTDRCGDPALNGIVINCRNVTERNELERQLRHAQKLDAVGQLAGGLAHDINNALAIVRGYAELVKSAFEPGSSNAADVAHIEQAVDRAASITRKVLAFSRRQPAQPAVLDLSAVVCELTPMLRQSATSRVTVRLELEPALWRVRADRGQMEQVLINLATNARDAMPDGGALTLRTGNLVVPRASTSPGGPPPGEYVVLTVRDEGTGMTPEVLARIFEPFFTTKVGSEGMGLGLAMVRDIVLSSRGQVEVDSAPGQGTVFRILLPRTEAAAAAAPVEASPGERRGTGMTVLVVDDEENVRKVARRMLERHGCHVIEAPGGLEALEAIESDEVSVDVLLTDLVMPGLDGRQLIARCGTLRPSLPVVCMTGFAGEDDLPGQYGQNLVALLSKPFSLESLVEAIDAAAARAGVR